VLGEGPVNWPLSSLVMSAFPEICAPQNLQVYIQLYLLTR
jgi:hypothetical protein